VPSVASWFSAFQTLSTVPLLIAGAYGNGKFVLITDNYIITRNSKTSWMRERISTVLFAIGFGDDRFVIFSDRGDTGVVLSSSDGVNWSKRDTGFPGWIIHNLIYGREGFVAVGQASRIYTSTNGLSWIGEPSPSLYLRAAAFGTDSIVVVGSGGLIIQSKAAFSRALVNTVFLGNEIQFVLSEGEAPYRLQTSTNVTSNVWTDLSLITNSVIRVQRSSLSGDHYFRAVPTF
jgi:hypothetical protein